MLLLDWLSYSHTYYPYRAVAMLFFNWTLIWILLYPEASGLLLVNEQLFVFITAVRLLSDQLQWIIVLPKKSADRPIGPFIRPELNPSFLSMNRLGVFLLPLPLPIYRREWLEAILLAQELNPVLQPGVEPGLLDPHSSTLTIRPPSLPLFFNYFLPTFFSWIACLISTFQTLGFFLCTQNVTFILGYNIFLLRDFSILLTSSALV